VWTGDAWHESALQPDSHRARFQPVFGQDAIALHSRPVSHDRRLVQGVKVRGKAKGLLALPVEREDLASRIDLAALHDRYVR
jgi:hypothetical protein